MPRVSGTRRAWRRRARRAETRHADAHPRVTVTNIDLGGLRQLLGDGAQLVEVLPSEEYIELHLPGAINIPLKQLSAESVRQLDPDRDVIVYCWDGLCDMSPRAACWLSTMGFTRVHDYAPGKVDWLAHGLPADGSHADRPTAASLARGDVVTCSIEDQATDVLERVAGSPYGFALVLSPTRVLLGRVRRSVLETVGDGAGIGPIIEPGPSTIRAHLTADELRKRLEDPSIRTLVVTTPGGALLGVVRRDDVPA
jgi:rhodanese-related sulfurtransferase